MIPFPESAARRFAAGALFLLLIAVPHVATASGRGDFNGDGLEDLAIAAPGENQGAGVVHVLYGKTPSLTAAGSQVWSQASTFVPDAPEAGDAFGAALAIGDFDGDGFDDLAIGVPGEDQSATDMGVVIVLWGTAAGLTGTGSELIHQESHGLDLSREASDRFGASLASGDFDGDGFDDLAIGAPGEHIVLTGPASQAGALGLLYGSAAGFDSDRSGELMQAHVGGVPESDDRFTESLVAADFDRDGFDDLAIGAPGERTGGNRGAGAVFVVYGTFDGIPIGGSRDQFWSQDTSGISGGTERDDHFGKTLASGDFNGDGFGDLAIGVPNEDTGSRTDDGFVHVLLGRPGGLSTIGARALQQGNSGLLGAPESGDRFGSALAAGDFDGDGRDDLAIGVPFEDVNQVDDGGGVHVIYGGTNGLTQENHFLRQGLGALPDTPERFDAFGTALSVGDFNGSTTDDLVIGVPEEDTRGAVHVLYGSTGGFANPNNQLWSQDSPSIDDVGELGDRFGGALPGNPVASGSGFSGEWLEAGQQCRNKCTLIGLLSVTNPGRERTLRSEIDVVLSDDAQLDEGDRVVDTVKLKELDPGETREVEIHHKLAHGESASGRFLIAILDARNATPELNERNNVVVSGQLP